MSEFSRRKLRYSILKEMDKGKMPTHETFNIEAQEFIDFLDELQEDSYITGITFTKLSAFGRPRLTDKGEQYVDENSGLSKSYKVAKELRDWIKL